MTRDAAGRAAVRAVRVTSPLRIDGRLDDEIYTTTRSFSGLIQMEPREGEPATQNTEAWLLFDEENVYVAVKCWEARPDRMIADEMRRDGSGVFRNDYLALLFDTYYDRRSAYYFAVTPAGGVTDGQITNERQFSSDWNGVWNIVVGRFEGGWTIEAAIPFKSLRYRPGREQIWGFNIERSNRWKFEEAFLTAIPASFGWSRGWLQVSYSATVFGIEAPPASRNIEVKPYVVSNLASDRTASVALPNPLSGAAGIDVKYGLTQNLTADFTYNTDFAHVEADQQQVNLTRFNLFFGEKREFFLENQGTFGFGGLTASGAAAASEDTPTLFYSRRIGLNQGRAIPIDAGGRLTGRLGRFTLGVLQVRTGADNAPSALAWGSRSVVPSSEQSPPTDFTVVRVKRDVLRRSSIGAIYTGRSVDRRTTTGSLDADEPAGGNEAFGADANFVFGDALSFNSYWARTRTAGTTGENTSYRMQADYAGDRYGLQAERLVVDRQFDPQVGFVRRPDMRKTSATARFSPRPASSDRIRKFEWIGSLASIANGAGQLETRQVGGEFAIDFQNSDELSVKRTEQYELVLVPFPVAGLTIPAGSYRFGNTTASYVAGPQRPLSGTVAILHGDYYGGRRTSVGVTAARVSLNAHLAFEPTMSINWLELPQGSTTARLAGARITYALTPRMFTSALIQYNSTLRSVSSNARLRWEYRPGSELFVVYNEERNTLVQGFPQTLTRTLTVKINRLFRF